MAKKTKKQTPEKKTVKVLMLIDQTQYNVTLHADQEYMVGKTTAHIWTGKGYAKYVK